MVISSSGLNAQGASDQAAEDASVLIVHGIPGLDIGEEATYPIDVYIDGTKRLSNVKYGQIKRIKTPSGTAAIALYRAGMGPGGGYPAVLAGDFSFKKQETASIVAYLHADGQTRLVKFTNDLSPAGDPSKCRVIAHNTSAEAKFGYWIFNNKPQIGSHPYMGTDLLDIGHKTVIELAKKDLNGKETFKWWEEIETDWGIHHLYKKPFIMKAGKAILVYIMGSSATKTLRLAKKTITLK